MTTSVARLLDRPFAVGSLTVPNRIVMAPMARHHSPQGVPGAAVAAYYARRAAAQVGTIIAESALIGHPAAGPDDDVPRFHGVEQLAGWERVADEVHRAGGKLVPQLWHTGMAGRWENSSFADVLPVGPSRNTAEGAGGSGRAMGSRDIDDVVQAFAEAAAAAEEIGCDGVELHGAHGYLIDQFLWSRTNCRTDAYGGDPVSRTRFAAEIVMAIRTAVRPDFPVFLRFSQWKGSDYTARLAETPTELEKILVPLAEAGVDVFHASTRRYWTAEFPDTDLTLAGWAKKLTGKPTIAVGSVGLANEFLAPDGAFSDPAGLAPLAARLERDEFDLVAVGRALLADPEWARKALSGLTHAFKPYTAESKRNLY